MILCTFFTLILLPMLLDQFPPLDNSHRHTPIFKPRSEVPDISCRKTTALDLSTTTHAGKRQFVDGAGWLYVRRGRWPSDMVLRPRKAVFLFPDNFCAGLLYLGPVALRARPGKKTRHKERHRQSFRSQFRWHRHAASSGAIASG